MKDYIFDECQVINDLISAQDLVQARDRMIRLLDKLKGNNIQQNNLVNHLVRKLGLYPYIKGDAEWQDKIAYDAFKVNIGDREEKTLHIEQSKVLKRLLSNESLAISAPTSFGKSFIIDAFIAIKKPSTVVIIVPTIALTDETRRRLYSKFSEEYTIITTPDVDLGDKNIFIFPQERVFGYLDKINSIDILIVDEFYKAEPGSDERANILLKAILELGKKAKQRYYLAPNINNLEDNTFTQGMQFEEFKLKTVVTNFYNDYLSFTDKETKSQKKKDRLVEIITSHPTKNLVYAGSYSQTDEVINTLLAALPDLDSPVLKSFSEWLKENYSQDYLLAKSMLKGVGVHNGKLHRSLSQIQIKLFEKDSDINTLVSTSSIIEGVNTSAENVILWSNRNGRGGLTSFEYNNIAGRGGRMFKYFVGNVFALEEPPANQSKQLKLDMPEDVLFSLDTNTHSETLTREQIIKIIAFQEEVDNSLGKGIYNRMINDSALKAYSGQEIRSVLSEILESDSSFKTLVMLNSNNVKDWNAPLRDVFFHMGHMDLMDWQFIRFVKILSRNWELTLPQLFEELKTKGVPVDINNFFDLERIVTFDMSSALGKINTILKYSRNNAPDFSTFIFKASHAFLPKLVYELEEYGLPRMMSRKIHNMGVIDLERKDISINQVLSEFKSMGIETLKQKLEMTLIEEYILDYFYQGITKKG